MAIPTNPKATIYRNLYENKGPGQLKLSQDTFLLTRQYYDPTVKGINMAQLCPDII